jgi:hypothetical protein
MAGDLSDAGEALVRRWLFSDSPAPRPTGWFLALYTAAPGDGGGGIELAGAGYARQAIAFDAEGAANAGEVVFGPAAADWGAVTHGAVFDDVGRFLAWTALAAAIAVPNGESLRFPAGSITAAFD